MTAVLQQPTTTNVTAVVLPGASLRNALSACLLAAAKGPEALPVLMAVHVAKDGDRLTFRSTDRNRLVTVSVTLLRPPAGNWETLIPASDVKRAVAGLPKTRRGSGIATIAPDAIGCLLDGGSHRFTPLDSQFPKTAQLIPTGTAPVEEIGFQTQHLADLAKMPGRGRNEPARLRFNGPTKQVVSEWIDVDDENVLYVCVMLPVRLS